MNEITKNLMGARKAYGTLGDNWSLDLLNAAQDAYDESDYEGNPPDRPMTRQEYSDLQEDVLAALNATIDTRGCKVGDCDNKAECETCMRLHCAIYCSPPCIEVRP
jgi:hypothetical protein